MEPSVVNIHQAKTHFSRLVERAERGERITIARAGKPVAVLIAVESQARLERPIGIDRGRIVVHPSFFERVPEWETVRDFPGPEPAGGGRRAPEGTAP